MAPSRFTLPSFEAILPDLAAFATGIACAWTLGWNTTDLVWSLWLSSLVLGYLSILAVIGKGLYIGSGVVFNQAFPAQYRTQAISGGCFAALFLVAFFSVHFCGFHAIHAKFLSVDFPLSGVPKGGIGDGFINPIPLWQDVFHYVMPRYGIS